MAQLQSTNIVGTLSVNGVAVGGGKDFKYCCMSGSTTWTPSSDLVDGDGVVEATLLGGGGGGGGVAFLHRYCTHQINGSSERSFQPNEATGGGGTTVRRSFPITSTSACTVTVGAGGNGGEVFADCTCVLSGTGGSSIFGGVTALGGGGGQGFLQFCTNDQYGPFGQSSCRLYSDGNGRANCTATDPRICAQPWHDVDAADYWEFATASIDTPYYYNSCGGPYITDNEEVWGALGTDKLVGGIPANDYTSSLTSSTTGKTFGTRTCICQSTVLEDGYQIDFTPPSHDERFRGSSGGSGYTIVGSAVCDTAPAGASTYGCANVKGQAGIGGIVILKWYE